MDATSDASRQKRARTDEDVEEARETISRKRREIDSLKQEVRELQREVDAFDEKEKDERSFFIPADVFVELAGSIPWDSDYSSTSDYEGKAVRCINVDNCRLDDRRNVTGIYYRLGAATLCDGCYGCDNAYILEHALRCGELGLNAERHGVPIDPDELSIDKEDRLFRLLLKASMDSGKRDWHVDGLLETAKLIRDRLLSSPFQALGPASLGLLLQALEAIVHVDDDNKGIELLTKAQLDTILAPEKWAMGTGVDEEAIGEVRSYWEKDNGASTQGAPATGN